MRGLGTRAVPGGLQELPAAAAQAAAPGAVPREFPEFGDTLKYLVPNKLHHMTGPESPEHQGIKHAHTHLSRAVFRVTPITHAHRLQLFAQLAFFKEPAEQTHATKSGQILRGELLLRGRILFFLLFLCYTFVFTFSLFRRILFRVVR
ncbi:MAG: hypothetical protein ACLQJ7_10030 [Syntrophobacteraceae bacterium]